MKAAYKALKGIVDIAGKEGVAKPEAGATAVKVGSADNKDGAKILSTGALISQHQEIQGKQQRY